MLSEAFKRKLNLSLNNTCFMSINYSKIKIYLFWGFKVTHKISICKYLVRLKILQEEYKKIFLNNFNFDDKLSKL